MMKRIAFATFVAIGMAAGAVAQQTSQQPTRSPPGNDRTNQVSFEQADKNKDGKVNQEEGNMIGGFDFSRADTNSDASLTRAEYEAAMAKSTPRTDGQQGDAQRRSHGAGDLRTGRQEQGRQDRS